MSDLRDAPNAKMRSVRVSVFPPWTRSAEMQSDDLTSLFEKRAALIHNNKDRR